MKQYGRIVKGGVRKKSDRDDNVPVDKSLESGASLKKTATSTCKESSPSSDEAETPPDPSISPGFCKIPYDPNTQCRRLHIVARPVDCVPQYNKVMRVLEKKRFQFICLTEESEFMHVYIQVQPDAPAIRIRSVTKYLKAVHFNIVAASSWEKEVMRGISKETFGTVEGPGRKKKVDPVQVELEETKTENEMLRAENAALKKTNEALRIENKALKANKKRVRPPGDLEKSSPVSEETGNTLPLVSASNPKRVAATMSSASATAVSSSAPDPKRKKATHEDVLRDLGPPSFLEGMPEVAYKPRTQGEEKQFMKQSLAAKLSKFGRGD
jgi:hypothetical protein